MRPAFLRKVLGLALLLGAAITALAQPPAPPPEPKAVRLGVPMMQITARRSVDRRLQRDWLVREFEPGKKKKKKPAKGPVIEAVALESATAADALAEAREKDCDYVLFITLAELREPGERDLRRPDPGNITFGAPPLSSYPDPTQAHSLAYYARIDYRLQRMGEHRAILDTSVSGTDNNDENGTVHGLLFMIVNRVEEEIRADRKLGPD